MTTYRGGFGRTTFLERCRAMRRDATDAEALLWRLVRNRQVCGVKFRRQHQFGPYILDFYCAELRLAVEVDGGHHFEPDQAEYDALRSDELAAGGVTVVRFTNVEVLAETEAVAGRLWDAVETLTPSPSPRGRGGPEG